MTCFRIFPARALWPVLLLFAAMTPDLTAAPPGALSHPVPAAESTPAPVYDTQWFMDAADLIQQTRQKKALFLVDIRHENEFNTYKIPGSIHVPLAFIKAKTFLKTRPVVLIHQKCRYSTMIPAARSLTRKGYQVRILFGGLNAWLHKKGQVVGDPFAPRKADVLTPADIFPEQNHAQWIPVRAAPDPTGRSHPLFSRAVPLSGTSLPGLLNQRPGTSLLVFTPDGSGYDAIRKTLPPAVRDRVFFLKGGSSAFTRFETMVRLAAQPKPKRLKTTGRCLPCERLNEMPTP